MMTNTVFQAGTPCPDCGGTVHHTGDLVECIECGKCKQDGSEPNDQLIEDDTVPVEDEKLDVLERAKINTTPDKEAP